MLDKEHPPSQAELDRWKDWDPQHGYYSDPDFDTSSHDHDKDINEILKHESLPRRSIAPGLHAGLTVVLNAEKDEYYCSGRASGFRVSPFSIFYVNQAVSLMNGCGWMPKGRPPSLSPLGPGAGSHY